MLAVQVRTADGKSQRSLTAFLFLSFIRCMQPASRLSLCKWYSRKSCCIPQQDGELGEFHPAALLAASLANGLASCICRLAGDGFNSLLNLGRGCLRTNTMCAERSAALRFVARRGFLHPARLMCRYDEMRQYYCMGCDPNSPKYAELNGVANVANAARSPR